MRGAVGFHVAIRRLTKRRVPFTVRQCAIGRVIEIHGLISIWYRGDVFLRSRTPAEMEAMRQGFRLIDPDEEATVSKAAG